MKKILISLILAISVWGAVHLFSSSSYPITNAKPSGENIICFGDSLTYGTGASADMDYPAQLSRMIRKPIINAGVPGNTTSDGLKRLEDDVLSQSPKIVMITLGGNDLRNGISKDAAFSNLNKIIRLIQKKGALVIIGGVDIPFMGRGFGKAYQVLAKETGSVLVLNVFEGIMGKSDLMSDFIHPNDKGYTLMAQKFYTAIQPYLQ
jgi:acyl-CoA thioesterase I